MAVNAFMTNVLWTAWNFDVWKLKCIWNQSTYRFANHAYGCVHLWLLALFWEESSSLTENFKKRVFSTERNIYCSISPNFSKGSVTGTYLTAQRWQLFWQWAVEFYHQIGDPENWKAQTNHFIHLFIILSSSLYCFVLLQSMHYHFDFWAWKFFKIPDQTKLTLLSVFAICRNSEDKKHHSIKCEVLGHLPRSRPDHRIR